VRVHRPAVLSSSVRPNPADRSLPRFEHLDYRPPDGRGSILGQGARIDRAGRSGILPRWEELPGMPGNLVRTKKRKAQPKFKSHGVTPGSREIKYPEVQRKRPGAFVASRSCPLNRFSMPLEYNLTKGSGDGHI